MVCSLLQRIFTLAAALAVLSSCAVVPQDPKYAGPLARPETVSRYYDYNRNDPYHSISEQVRAKKRQYVHKRIIVGTDYGQLVVEYYQRKKPTDNLIFVFPILGGEHLVEGYFAKYFAEHGFDTAIVHRDPDFKRPEMFVSLEDIFRYNVIRDRIVMDFFEREYGKKKFGSFGISRGAMNAAVTAGVDDRLRYNVLALGGSHLVDIFKKSDVGGISRYRNRVIEATGMTPEQFYDSLENGIITDPKNLAHYLDARNTLMFLSVFDQSVPFKYGLRLREELGTPKTVFLLAGHITALLYTRFLVILPDFIESESLRFYNESFETGAIDAWHFPLRVLELPFEFLGYLYYSLF